MKISIYVQVGLICLILRCIIRTGNNRSHFKKFDIHIISYRILELLLLSKMIERDLFNKGVDFDDKTLCIT